MDQEFQFQSPPLAPIFEPTAEEFSDFYEYLRDIFPVIVKTGVCKIRPPKGWKPPFCIDIDTFKFTPRIQRLNELEATSRVKLNFLDQLARFWELQGVRLRVPCVDKKHVDLHRLSQAVRRMGGYDAVCADKQWPQVAEMTGYPATSGKCVPGQLRQHYERLVRPFDIFKVGASTDVGLLRAKSIERQAAASCGGGGGGGGGPPTRRCGARGGLVRQASASSSMSDVGGAGDCGGIDYAQCKELRRLQYFGAGPKAAVPSAAGSPEKQPLAPVIEPTRMEVKLKREGAAGWLDSLLCRVCGTSAKEELLLICELCQAPFHTYCLFPPLPDVPKGEWRCPACVAKSFERPSAEYGFEQSRRHYTLAEFGTMADQFKAAHFHKSLHCIGYAEVEREFWRLLQALDEPLAVEYGADLHSSSAGSGFPTPGRRPRVFESPEEAANWDAYQADPWNLNNLPLNDRGFLRFLQQDINGMVIPWCYVGMAFSAFCWHIEDHWSYSINYLHWGEPKTWYGVPAHDAEALERVMRREAGELFETSPDLLHHITTIINPNRLMEAGVSVHRIDQEAGDFVITCPRAYHAGFNQGFNFAEAVNFCPPDWLPMGRECVDSYGRIGRHCVFSHEELVCAAAIATVQKPACIKDSQLPELLAEVRIVADREERDLQALTAPAASGGARGRFDPNERSFQRFEMLPDDDRQCGVCSTTLYVSAIVCQCLPRRLLCPSHADMLCPKCSSSLLYRHSVPELRRLESVLAQRVAALEDWQREAAACLAGSAGADPAARPPRERLVGLCQLAGRKLGLPRSCHLLAKLHAALALADQAASIVQVLLKPLKTGGKAGNKPAAKAASPGAKVVPFASFQAFRAKLAGLACTVDGQAEFEALCRRVDACLERCRNFLAAATAEATAAASEDRNPSMADEADALVSEAASLPVALEELPQLRELAGHLRWREEIWRLLRGQARCSMARMEALNAQLPPASLVGQQLLVKFRGLYDKALQITYGVKILLQASACTEDFDQAEANLMVEQAARLPVDIESISRLADLAASVERWQQQLQSPAASAAASPSATGSQSSWTLAEADRLIKSGQSIGVRLKRLTALQRQVDLAHAWLRKAGEAFLLEDAAAAAGAANCPEAMESALLAAILPAGLDGGKFVSIEPDQAPLRFEEAAAWELRRSAAAAAGDTGAARTKRPGMDTLLALLVALRGFPLRMAAGLAIRLLAERAMAWRQRVHDCLLSTAELRAALLQLARAMHFRQLPDRLLRQLRVRLGEAADAELAGVSSRRPRKSLLFPRAPMDEVSDCIVDAGEDLAGQPPARTCVTGVRLSADAAARLGGLLAEGRLIEVGIDEVDWLRLMLHSATGASVSAAAAESASVAVAAKRARLADA